MYVCVNVCVCVCVCMCVCVLFPKCVMIANHYACTCRFGLVSLCNGISTLMGYVMSKISFRRTVVVIFNP